MIFCKKMCCPGPAWTSSPASEDYPRACYVGQLGSQVFLMAVRGPELEKPLDLLAERLAAEAV